jgi:hypothetical protein
MRKPTHKDVCARCVSIYVYGPMLALMETLHEPVIESLKGEICLSYSQPGTLPDYLQMFRLAGEHLQRSRRM